MNEATWYKMLVLSTILHFFVVGIFSIPIKKSSRKIDLSSSYSVNLVGDIGGAVLGATGGYKGKTLPRIKEDSSKPAPPTKVKKPVPVRQEKDAISLSKKKVRAKETPSKEELSRLEEKIREIKRRTGYLDVAKAGKEAGSGKGGSAGSGSGAGFGLPLSSEGGSRPLDPVSQKYMLEVWEKIKNAWGLPGITSFKKQLETIVTIKIRKDGRIVDINIEKRSGNRIYDESILRVLRAVDPLPPIPASLNTESIEIGFRFLPGDIS